MSLTSSKQQLWNDYAVGGIYNSTHVGQFNSFQGTIYQVANGPYATGMSNNSSDGHGQSGDIRVSNSGANGAGLWTISDDTFSIISGNLFIDTVNPVAAIKPIALGFVTSGFWYGIGIGGNGNFYWVKAAGTYTDLGVAIPRRQWMEIQICRHKTSSLVYDMTIQYRLHGTSTWVTIMPLTSTTLDSAPADMFAGCVSFGTMDLYTGRTGACTYLTGTSTADFFTPQTAFPSGKVLVDITAPPAYFINAASGTDTTWTAGGGSGNDGVTSNHAVKSLVVFSTNTTGFNCFAIGGKNTGIDNAIAGVDQGTAYTQTTKEKAEADILSGGAVFTGPVITVAANSQIPVSITAQVQFNVTGGQWVSDGYNGLPGGPQVVISGFKQMTPTNWTKTAGATNIYQNSTDWSSQAVPYQNTALLNAILGANITAVKSALDAAPGSYFNDNSSTIYVNALKSTNPASDGNNYQTSVGAALADSNSAMTRIGVASMSLKGFYIDGANAEDNTSGSGPFNTYAMQIIPSGGNGVIYLDRVTVDHYSSHAFFVLYHANNQYTILRNCIGQRGNPFSNNGGVTWSVDFEDTAGLTGCGTIYDTCSDGVGAVQQPGSTLGYIGSNVQFWTAHTTGGGVLLPMSAGVAFNNCEFPTCSLGASLQGTVPYTITGGTIGGPPGGQPSSVYTDVEFVNIFGGGFTGTSDNCLIKFGNLGSGQIINLSGTTAVFDHSTIDYSGINSARALFNSGGTNSLTFTGCVVLTNGHELIDNFGSSETFVSSYNEYQGNTSAIIANFSSGGNQTLAQLQASGKDIGSAMVVTPAVNPNSSPIPYQRTAVSTVSHPVGERTDLSGILWANYQDAGANGFQTSGGFYSSSQGNGMAKQAIPTSTISFAAGGGSNGVGTFTSITEFTITAGITDMLLEVSNTGSQPLDIQLSARSALALNLFPLKTMSDMRTAVLNGAKGPIPAGASQRYRVQSTGPVYSISVDGLSNGPAETKNVVVTAVVQG